MHPLNGFAQERRRVRAIMSRVMVGEELADVRQPERTEQCVRHRVQQRVAIGVGDRSAWRFDPNAAEHEGSARSLRRDLVEAVQVVPVTDPHPTVSPWGG